MACPLFVPLEPLGEFFTNGAPLGDLYRGECAVDPGGEIPCDLLREFCNFGYARRQCGRAAHVESDAVRFLVKGEREGVLEIAWAMERDHHPVAVGTLFVGSDTGAECDSLTCQARACAVAYRRVKEG